jgi:hypothetical protein
MPKVVKATAVGPVSNGAKEIIAASEPYAISITIEGTAAFLYHRWNCESVEAKGKAAKGSKAKKEDDIESYVLRDAKGWLAIPGEYFRQSIIHAAKYEQDPRSPRKSAMDLFKAGVVILNESAPVGKATWDYLDKRRVSIQRNSVSRVRPALLAGWRATFELQILLPEYIGRDLLLKVANNAGRLVGVGDFRPTFGRFQIVDVAD